MKTKFNKPLYAQAAFLLLFLTVISMGSCKKEVTPGPNQVFMQNTAFNPSSLTVPVNTTVTWTNKDGMTHNVTSTTGVFSSGNIADGGTFSYQFTKAGTFPYQCTIHAGMTGTVIVQ